MNSYRFSMQEPYESIVQELAKTYREGPEQYQATIDRHRQTLDEINESKSVLMKRRFMFLLGRLS